MSRRLLFVGPNSYVVRNWVASGLADAVRDDLALEPVFVTPFADAAFESPTGERYANHTVPSTSYKGQDLPADFPRLLWWLYYLRLRTFAQEVENGSIQLMALASRRDWIHYAVHAVRTLLPRGSARRRGTRRLLDAINPRHAASAAVLDRVQPAAVIVGSPGMLFLDQLMIVEAQRRGIPVHCIVNSWDNLSSRGAMIRRPDTVMVWNRFMAAQGTEIHEYPAERIHVVGALQFTEYGTPPSADELQALYRRLELPVGTPYLLYFTGQHVPEYEAEDVAALLRALEGTPFADHMVVVRVHPQAPLEPFRDIRHPRLVLDLPPRFAARGANGAAFDSAEIRAMGALLAQSTVVFSSWATTALLEAAIFDRPIIQLRWMDAVPRAKSEQAARVKSLQRYEHLKALDAAGCRLFSDQPSDLPQRLGYLVTHAVELQTGRAQAARTLATFPLDKVPQRIVAVLRPTLRPDAAPVPIGAA